MKKSYVLIIYGVSVYVEKDDEGYTSISTDGYNDTDHNVSNMNLLISLLKANQTASDIYEESLVCELSRGFPS